MPSTGRVSVSRARTYHLTALGCAPLPAQGRPGRQGHGVGDGQGGKAEGGPEPGGNEGFHGKAPGDVLRVHFSGSKRALVHLRLWPDGFLASTHGTMMASMAGQ